MSNNTKDWTNSDLNKLFRIQDRFKSRHTLLNAEERGDIPKALRVYRGSISVRKWSTNDLPLIGEKFGFLNKSKGRKVISIYTPKGGVLKSSFAFNLARVLALNSIRTLIIGLDFQCSITNYAMPLQKVETLNDIRSEVKGLYHFYEDKISDINSLILHTNLPTLDVLPEVPELFLFEKKLRNEPRREYYFNDKFMDSLDYDVIIFDNGPSWNQLVENSLTASNIIISPMGCDYETYTALKTNLSIIFDFQKNAFLKWNDFIQVPTLLEKTNISQQIYGGYLNLYGDRIIPFGIRRSVAGQEARVFGHSVLEQDPNSFLSQDYYDVIQAIWNRINN